VLGPGRRFALWLQGCPFDCKGCYSPQWIPVVPRHKIKIDDLIQLVDRAGVEGLTISGGEPFIQVKGIFNLVSSLKKSRPGFTVIVYTGFKLENLLNLALTHYNRLILQTIDVLIDSPYIEKLNNNKGLRGSTNQRIWHLTDRFRDFDFVNQPRRTEIQIENGVVSFTGVPSRTTQWIPEVIGVGDVRT
jgi:anaerobic ribonucleoside-triphosphate reductase activating protein